MIKILGGERRGAHLETLEGNDTRPLRARIRQALFNIIRPRLAGSVVWDCFSGSGAAGLEALSNGAAKAVLIDANPKAVAVIQRNVRKLRYEAQTCVLTGELPGALRLVPPSHTPPDLILVMPPYFSGLGLDVLQALGEKSAALRKNPLVMLELHQTESVTSPAGWNLVDRREYGITTLNFFTFNPTLPTD